MTDRTLARPGSLQLLRTQFRYQNLVFWRTPISAFFSLIFPVLLFVIFALAFGNAPIKGLDLTTGQYFAPAIAVFATASAAYVNLGITTAYQRDFGILKRVRGTPLPPWIYLASKVMTSVLVGAIAAAVMLTIGFVAYGLELPLRTVPAMVVTFLLGASSFAALGMLLAALTGSGESATAIGQATLLPLAFFSGNFFVSEQLPGWLSKVALVFPLRHFNDAFFAPFDPATKGAGFEWLNLGVVALWGVAAAVIAVRYFRWE
jgi:ABC-2 type transport system permease protein